MPPSLKQTLPWVCATGFTIGVVLAIFYPGLSRALACSLIGMTLLVAMGTVAVQALRPDWLLAVPGGTGVQGLTLAALGRGWRGDTVVDDRPR